MTESQRIVEAIRNFLRSGHQTAIDQIRGLAQEYSDACEEANRRLARCEDFLRQGLLSEAVHFAQAEPNLLDVLTILDFGERPEWDRMVVHYNLPSAPVFSMAAAAALNQAYAQLAPLEALLKRHRLLALARAPLGERLAVLRQIAQLDPGSQVWNQDIAGFEKVRLQQMRGEVEQLRRQPSAPPLSQLEALFGEVQDPTWKVPVPADVVAMIQEMLQAAREKHLKLRADQLSTDLCRAHNSQNEFQARLLAQEWQQLTQQLFLQADEPAVRRASVVLQWLVKLDRQQANSKAHQEAVEELQRALDDPDTPPEDLEDLYTKLAKRKAGVPAHVESVYRRRVRNIVTARKRRERAILVGLFVACLSICAFVAVYFLYLR